MPCTVLGDVERRAMPFGPGAPNTNFVLADAADLGLFVSNAPETIGPDSAADPIVRAYNFTSGTATADGNGLFPVAPNTGETAWTLRFANAGGAGTPVNLLLGRFGLFTELQGPPAGGTD